MSWYDYGLVGLFVVCFISSTIYPLGSEAFVLGFVAFDFDVLNVWLVASVGNTLGSLSTYYLAYFGGEAGFKRLCPTPHKAPRAYKAYVWLRQREESIKRYGFFYAFFVFLPFVGDIFALLLGLVRYNQILCIISIALGKAVRYGLLLIPFWW